jgi:hypothetical protein
MTPTIQPSYLGVLVAVVASFAFGWIWYGPLFGKFWLQMMNMKMDKPKMSDMIKPMIIGLIGTFLCAHVLVYATNIWRPSVWGIGMDEEWYIYGCMSGLYAWLGFQLPLGLSSVAWEGRSWKLFSFNTVYQFLNLQIIAMIVSYMYGR